MSNAAEGIKTFVVDTNVLIHNPESLLSFRSSSIVLPLWVLEELDTLKTYPDQRGKSARDAIRFLDSAGKKGSLYEGVKLDNGSVLRVDFSLPVGAPEGIDLDKGDNKIIMCAYRLVSEGQRVFFVSKDINARVKAAALGIRAVDYEKQKVDIASLYQGCREIDASDDTRRDLLAYGRIPWKERYSKNEFAILRDPKGSESLVARYDEANAELALLEQPAQPVCGIMPANDRQRIALEVLLDDSIKLVTLVGKAGTGKTLLAIAAGLKRTLEDKRFARMLISRPVVPVGKDIGYLPGEKSAKMANWMQPLFDNLDFILGNYKRPNLKSMDQLVKDKVVEIEALSYIRGRSLPNQYIIIDEAQNLTPHEIKTIVSRAGEGSKVVLTGDPYQIDNLYLDENSNGLSYLVESFKGQGIYGHVTLQKTERSELAELASSLL
jgi:PhoH-like ATPase